MENDGFDKKKINGLTTEFCTDKKSMFYKGGEDGLKHIGFLSLKVALENYFSTYSAIRDSLIENCSYGIRINELESIEYTNEYCKVCSETIIHFQHFFELIIKDILENDNPLLAVNANKNNIIFHKLIKGELINDNEWDKLYSIEFNEALERFYDLLENERIKDKEKYSFFKDKKGILKALNVFRNRTWHKGMFLLRYGALDEFVGKYILPLVKDIVNISDYSTYKDAFMFKDNYIHVNIIDELIKENRMTDVDSGKIAFLKEMGRASYILTNRTENFYDYSSIINEQGECGFILGIQTCPVCGKETLLLRCEWDSDTEELCGDTGNYSSYSGYSRYENDVTCMNCSFSLNKYVQNLNAYGFSFNDFWRDYEIIDD